MQDASSTPPAAGPAGGSWRFGRAELDEAQLRLTLDGRPVPLDRSGYRLLRCLLLHSGELVSKDELMRAGWPGRLVSANSLPKAISRLRQALDDPDGEVLRVEHGYGYRLVPPPGPAASAIVPAAGAASPPDRPMPASPAPGVVASAVRSSRWRATALLVATAVGLVWFGARSSADFDAASGTRVPEARAQFLLARTVFQDDETSNRRSVAAYRRAVELDPGYVDALLGLADVLGHSGLYADSAEEAMSGKQEALDAVDRAVALAPWRADALLLRGDLRYAHWWQWEGAEADLEQARRMDGVDETSYLLRLARLRAATGRMDEALALTGRILASNPMSEAAAPRAYHLLSVGRHAEAKHLLQDYVKRNPLDEHAHYYLGLIELLQGQPRTALAHFDDSAYVFRLTGSAIAWHELGNAVASARNLQLLKERYGHILPYQVAEVHAWRGEHDLAFEWLQRSAELHDASIMYLTFDPLLGGIRHDPRYREFLRRVGLGD
jgi:DNA-binding winged helix-turn-helix (wHTH) protein/tetratricopeptide (TPR) repeat protein